MFHAPGQTIIDYRLPEIKPGVSLQSVLESIPRDTFRLFYNAEWVAPVMIESEFHNATLRELLDHCLMGTDLSYIVMYPDALVILKDPEQAIARSRAIELAYQQKKEIEAHKIGTVGATQATRVTISGTVTDAKSQEPLANANVSVYGTGIGTVSDERGHYSIELPVGVYALTVSYIDFEDKVIDLEAYANGKVDIVLDHVPVLLDEVLVSAQSKLEIASSRIGQTQINLKDLKRAPSLLGETDLIKQIQLLPGVTTVGEAAAGFNVRGGSVDQNLVLYDAMPVFNSFHVFGFLSAFNSQAIRDVNFYNGGIPAEFGGRISSVLDIQSKDGDPARWQGKAGIGLMTSNVMVEGPLAKDRTTLVASFRTTYSNWLVHSIRTDYADLSDSKVHFYDLSAKLAHRLNDDSKLSLSTYMSSDAFRLFGDSTYRWNNLAISAKFDHQFSDVLSSEIVAGVSRYGYRVENAYPQTASVLSYQLTSMLMKAAFEQRKGQHNIHFGYQFTYTLFDPGTLRPDGPQSNAASITLDRQYSNEHAIYVSDGWPLTDRLSAEAGLRVPVFISFGPADVYRYHSGPRETTNISDTVRYGSAEPVKTYAGVEPRLSVRYMMGQNASFKLGYNRMYQFIHLITNTAAVTPVDIWQPSGYYFKPQYADQVSLGYFRSLKARKYDVSAEAFYKNFHNILDFKDGAQLILNDHIETELLQGKGMSYGVETAIAKNEGRFTWSVNYTFARSFRTIGGPTRDESINEGRRYPANFDQPHIVNVSWKYNLTRRHFFTGNFTYHTGRPVTVPLSLVPVEHTSVAYFSDRNQYRIPDYHRLDLALVIEGNHKRRKLWSGTWVISVYNVYARRNAYTVFFKDNDNGVPQPYQLSIVGTVFPSISYNITF